MTQSSPILAVGFVTPAFLAAGGLLVSIPIIIHILNRRRFRTVEWAAMEFLLRAMRKNRRRIRFEQWLLLAVRCLVLLLMGAALARPMGCADTSLASLAGRRAGLHVIVIDNSYSMAYEADRPDAKTHLDQAKLLARRVIDRLSGGGEAVLLITASQPAGPLMAASTYDLDAARSAVDRVEQSYSGTDLPGALGLAGQIAARETRLPSRFLYLITDSTRSAWESASDEQRNSMRTTGRALARAYERITHFSLGRSDQWNAAVVEVAAASGLLRLGYPNELNATVRGFGSAREGLLRWKLDDQVVGTGETIRPQPDTRPFTEAGFQLARGGAHVVSVAFAGDDRLPVDDERHRVIDVAADLKVLIVEGERGVGALAGSGAFIHEALAPTIDNTSGSSAKRLSYLSPELISDIEFGNKVLADYRAIVLAGVGQFSSQQADQLEAFVRAGGTVMFFMGEAVDSAGYNELLVPRGLLPGALVKRVSIGSAAATGPSGNAPGAFYFDFRPSGNLHPLLRKFQGMEKSGLDTAAVYSYWQVDPVAARGIERVLDYQPAPGRDPGEPRDPAITVHELGRGRVLFFSTTGNADWNALPVKPNFAPLLHELLARSMTSGDAWMNLTVGEALRIPSSVQFTAAPVLRDPQQVEIMLEQADPADTAGRGLYRSRALKRPGLYTLLTGGAKLPVAVNVPPVEADVRTLDGAAIRRALGEIELDLQDDQLPAVVRGEESGTDFGWSVMILVLSLLGFECFLAMRFGHYRR